MYIDAAQHLRDRLSHATLTEPAGLCCIVDGSMVDGLDWSLSGNATESALDTMQCRNADVAERDHNYNYNHPRIQSERGLLEPKEPSLLLAT